ncbi:MAG: hypothetical protein H7A25_00240 [Leptospiraceae bacterium]|nr:hypothetical protein [Leptospiraceae bacterium]MCP5498304.1 hypothetical protein [Leptospiraceae bacterium]
MGLNLETDEDGLIYKLRVHRDLVTKVLKLLKSEGISSERTRNNDPNGDIIIFRVSDRNKVHRLMQKLKEVYN